MNSLLFSLAHYYPTNSSMAHKIYYLGYPVDYFWKLKNIRTVDISYLLSQLFILGDQFCRKCDSDTIEYFRPDPQSVANELNLPNLNVTSGHIKSSSMENGTDLHGIQSLVLAFEVSPGTQVFHADSADGSLPWDSSVVGECPYIVYPLDTFIYLHFSTDDISYINCPILGIKCLKVIDLCFTHPIYVHQDLIKQKYVPKIELVYIQINQLNNTEDFPEMFHQAVTLRDLDLSYNNIQLLPITSFQNLISLEKLNLLPNIMTSINLNLSLFTNFNVLDLSYNMLSYLDEPFQKQLEIVANNSLTFGLCLQGNPLSCRCESIQFLKWLQHTPVILENMNSMNCIKSNELWVKVDTQELENHCMVSYFIYYIIRGSLGTLVLVVILASVTTYRQCWKIAWHVYTYQRKFCTKNYQLLEEADEDKKYDTYVEYYRDDDLGLPWLKNTLLQFIEEELGKKLFIFDRDSIAGNSIIGETIGGIQQSRKVIFVLTDTYLKNQHWEMVLYWAVRQGLNNVIMCCPGDMSIDKLPQSLAKVATKLQEKYPTHYLEFPLEAGCICGNENNMWDGLKIALDKNSENE